MKTMRRAVSCALVILGAAVSDDVAAQASGADEAAVRAVVQSYFRGVDEHDAEALAEAFHPEAQLEASLGRYWEQPFEEWRNFTNRPVPSDADQRRNTILSIDIAGDAAVVKTELVWPTVRYVDYLSLLRIDGRWWIVNKIWHQERPGS